MKPLGPRILVKVLPRADLSAGGIVKPDTADQRPHYGEVVSAGNVDAIAEVAGVEIKPKDVVMFGRHAGIRADTADDELMILHVEECLTIVELDRYSCTVSTQGGDEVNLGEVYDLTVIDEADRFIVSGVLATQPEAWAESMLRSAGYGRLCLTDGDETIDVWRVSTINLLRQGCRLHAVGEEVEGKGRGQRMPT